MDLQDSGFLCMLALAFAPLRERAEGYDCTEQNSIMAAKNKTTETEANVAEFVLSFVDNEQKRAESFQLIELMTKWSGYEAKMWGQSIIGFGRYHYTYASGHEGDAPIIGFSPRKAEFSLYVYTPCLPEQDSRSLLEDLGRYKMGKACIYTKKLDDLKIPTLEKLCMATIAYIKEHYQCAG